jgi:ABC-2 type transport system permease protein
MIASLRAESIKARKRWANWILLFIVAAWVIAFAYLILFLVIRLEPQSIQGPIPASVLKRRLFPENFVPVALSSGASIGAAIMIILGTLSSASEYGWGTVQTILIQKPSRAGVLAGKWLAIGIATALISLAILAIGALASYGAVTIDGSSSVWPSGDVIVKGFGAMLLELLVWSGFGAFLGIAFRSTAGAIGGGLTYLFVGEALFGSLLRNTPFIKEVLKFLPGINADAVNAAFPLTIREGGANAPLVTAGRGIATLVVYLAAFSILSFLIFQRRDVGS